MDQKEEDAAQGKKRDAPEAPIDASLVGRISQSAVGLLDQAFRPTSSDAGNTLSQALNNNGKASGSSASASLRQHGDYEGKTDSNGTQLHNSGSAFVSVERFRSAPSKHHEGMSLDEFLDVDNNLAPQDDTTFRVEKGKAVARGTPGDKSSQPLPQHQLSRHEDGAEVSRLLSDLSFQPSTTFEYDLEEDYSIVLTVAEKADADYFSSHFDGHFLASQPLAQQLEEASNASRLDASSAELLSFFEHVENYQDEVWGYLKPIVAAAREEIKSSTDASGRMEEGPALRRLRMILHHIR